MHLINEPTKLHVLRKSLGHLNDGPGIRREPLRSPVFYVVLAALVFVLITLVGIALVFT